MWAASTSMSMWRLDLRRPPPPLQDSLYLHVACCGLDLAYWVLASLGGGGGGGGGGGLGMTLAGSHVTATQFYLLIKMSLSS